MSKPIHVLFSCGAPIAVQEVPFVLPEYGDKVSLTQAVYVPSEQPAPAWDGVIRPEDFETHTYWPEEVWRPGHIHKPEYGVRITHKPTGTQSSSHETKSVSTNKAMAMNALLGKLGTPPC